MKTKDKLPCVLRIKTNHGETRNRNKIRQIYINASKPKLIRNNYIYHCT